MPVAAFRSRPPTLFYANARHLLSLMNQGEGRRRSG